MLGGQPVSLATLFFAFLRVALSSFGAGPTWMHHMLVRQRRWLSEEEFAEVLSLCQLLPGPNIVNVAVCIGARTHGAVGSLTALAGFVVVPWVLGFIFGVTCLEYAHLPIVRNVLGGISAAAAGLIIATGIRLLRPHRARPLALLFAALAFAALAFGHLPLVAVIVVLGPLSVLAAALGGSRTR